MQVKDVMTQMVEVVTPAASLVEAARLMREDDVGILPVAEDDRLIGMVTDRDIVVRGVAAGKDMTATPVREVMSDHVLFCHMDDSLDAVSASMGELQVRRLPVINREKQLVGIVSLGDVAGAASDAAGLALEQIVQQPG